MVYYGKELYHWGIKGQKWGNRRYQNEDGSYTAEGQRQNDGHGRYADDDVGESDTKTTKKYDYSSKRKNLKTAEKERETALRNYQNSKTKLKAGVNKDIYEKANRRYNQLKKEYEENGGEKYEKKRKIIKTGAIVAGSILAVVGGYKLSRYMNDQFNIARLGRSITQTEGMKSMLQNNINILKKDPDAYKFFGGAGAKSAASEIENYTKSIKDKAKAAAEYRAKQHSIRSKHKYNLADKIDILHPISSLYKREGG